MDISKAIAIQGWMSKQELLWLAEQAEKHQLIVEIGSFLGRSTRALADHCSGTVYAVDDWYGPRDVELPKQERDQIFGFFVQNMDKTKARVIPITADHNNINLDINPDMVFIDGDHTYLNVKRDINFWKSKISIGGLLSGHDITLPEVYQAVTESLSFKTVPGTTIWYAIME